MLAELKGVRGKLKTLREEFESFAEIFGMVRGGWMDKRWVWERCADNKPEKQVETW